MFLLGGNHLIQAVRDIQSEAISVVREINISLYAGLTPGEARTLGNQHNFMMETLPITFQQKIEQARLFFKEGEKGKDLVAKIKQINQETDNNKSFNSDSCSTVKCIATYSDRTFALFVDLVKQHENTHGPNKNIPQRLFLALQGMDEPTVFSTLAQAKENGLGQSAIYLEGYKARSSLRKVFCSYVKIAEWEEALKSYPSANINIESFVGKKMKRKYVPQEFLYFCEECVQGKQLLHSEDETQQPVSEQIEDEIDITIQIKVNGKHVENKKILHLVSSYKSLFKKAICPIGEDEE